MVATARQQRGQVIAQSLPITRKGAVWLVPSQTGTGRYTVSPHPTAPHCTCPDHQETGQMCKHLFAVEYVVSRQEHPDGTTTVTETLTVTAPTCRPTYRQNWPAYNAAQSHEKELFQVLLRDLCAGLQDPPRPPTRGRRPVKLADAVFNAGLKVYTTVSGRRAMTDLRDAADDERGGKALHYNTVFKAMENPALTPVLRALIAESAAPLAAVEADFACDSSAFTTSKFVRWFDVKHGGVRSEHEWVKVQMMCGVKTNVVTTAVVCDRDGPDSPYLPQLVSETADRFAMRDVLADKGYSSAYGHEAVAAAGATPFIAFKKNATGKSGGVYQKMFHYFQYKRDEFQAHYHKRSNAESVFSAVKRKFGDSLRSKTRPAMVNELLLKFLCHNLCVLIQEMHELGVTPIFW